MIVSKDLRRQLSTILGVKLKSKEFSDLYLANKHDVRTNWMTSYSLEDTNGDCVTILFLDLERVTKPKWSDEYDFEVPKSEWKIQAVRKIGGMEYLWKVEGFESGRPIKERRED